MVAALALAAFAVRGGVANPAALVVPTVHQERAAALVAKLGDRQFTERDAAGRELEAMGRLALPAVRAGAKSADAETRVRCERLLPPMEAAELTARLMVFVTDADGRYEHRVPGWELFRAAAGDDRDARGLFAAATADRANWPLLTALRGPGAEIRPGLLAAAGGPGAWADRPNPAAAAKAAAVRRWEFFAAKNAPAADDDDTRVKRPEPTVPEMALVVLAETLHPERARGNRQGRYEMDVNSFFHTPPGRAALEGKGPFGPAFARLARVWLDTRDGDGALAAFAHAERMKFDPPTLCRYAARVAARREMPADRRLHCVALLVRENAVDHLGAVLAYLDDGEPAQPGLVRDHLLRAAVRLTGQDPADYGFADSGPGAPYRVPDRVKPKGVPWWVAGRRAAAFARWRDWEADRFGAAAGPAVVAGARPGQ